MLLRENYTFFCQCFHECSAKYDNFPLIDLEDLPSILDLIGIHIADKSKAVGELTIKKYRETLNIPETETVMLNRAKFAEALVLTIQAEREISKDDSYKDYNEFSGQLNPMFTRFIIPFLDEKSPEGMPISLNAFRNRYVWQEKVNSIIEMNLEGIMDVF